MKGTLFEGSEGLLDWWQERSDSDTSLRGVKQKLNPTFRDVRCVQQQIVIHARVTSCWRGENRGGLSSRVFHRLYGDDKENWQGAKYPAEDWRAASLPPSLVWSHQHGRLVICQQGQERRAAMRLKLWYPQGGRVNEHHHTITTNNTTSVPFDIEVIFSWGLRLCACVCLAGWSYQMPWFYIRYKALSTLLILFRLLTL